MTSTGYPLYAAAFLTPETLILGGGGGEGRHGIKNKLSVFSVPEGAIVNERELDEGEDNPTCMAIAGSQVVFGANRGSEKVKKGNNKHLRVYNGDLEEISSMDVFRSTNPATYQKAIAATDTLVAVVSDDPNGGSLYTIQSD